VQLLRQYLDWSGALDTGLELLSNESVQQRVAVPGEQLERAVLLQEISDGARDRINAEQAKRPQR